MKKRILITHNDLDGVSCAIVLKKKYPDIIIRYIDYFKIDEVSEELLNNQDEYKQIIFTDITPEKKYGKQMLDNSKFILIDHHKTRKYLTNSNNVIFNIKYCATYLSCQHYLNINDFVLAVDAWDTWKLDSTHRILGEDLNFLFEYYGVSEFVRRFSDMKLSFSEVEKTIIKVLRHLKTEYIQHKAKQTITKIDKGGNKYLQVQIGETQSGLSDLLNIINIPKDIKYLKCVNINDKTVSLYSLGFDVSKIAKKKGGGGHQKAAGYMIK